MIELNQEELREVDGGLKELASQIKQFERMHIYDESGKVIRQLPKPQMRELHTRLRSIEGAAGNLRRYIQFRYPALVERKPHVPSKKTRAT